MNPEVKAKWVAALRSGEFKQGKGRLRTGDTYCCLGVLCEVYSRETGRGEWLYDGASLKLSFLRHWFDLPEDVVEWAGLDHANPHPDLNGAPLSAYNDCGTPFCEIANIIETKL